MALPSSGAISLNDMHVEVGGTSGTLVSINDSDIRGLINKASGATMSFNEWYGASAELIVTVTGTSSFFVSGNRYGFVREGATSGTYSSTVNPSSNINAVDIDSGIIPDGTGISGMQWDLNILSGYDAYGGDDIQFTFTDASYPAVATNHTYWDNVTRVAVDWPKGDVKFSTNSSITANVLTITAAQMTAGKFAPNKFAYGTSQIGWNIPANSGEAGFAIMRDYFLPTSRLHSGTFYVKFED